MDLKQGWLSYIVCIVLFLIAMLGYFHPVLDGEIVKKGDHLNSEANSQETYEHREKFGEEPLWTNSQFSGMPTFQMSTHHPSNLIADIKTWLTKPYLPSKTGLIFTLFLGFFIMLLVMRVDPWLALIGGFAFAFSTYFLTSYEAGHTGKLRVLGFIAPCIATLYMTLKGRRILGGALTAFTVCAALASNHLQINYYLALFIVLIMIIEGIYAFQKGELKHYFLSASILLFAGILAIGPNVSSIWSTYTYSKETIRGGSSPLEKGKEEGGSGLDKDYAMRWSYGKAETFNLMIPMLYGGGSHTNPDEDSKTAKALKKRNLKGPRLERFLGQLPLYWGDQPFTSGPNYLGAVICFLFIAGLLLVKGSVRWWMLLISVLAIMMAWGRHFSAFNDFLFQYLPLYNKFRSPSMTLILVCFSAPLMGTLAVQRLMRDPDQDALKKFRWAFYATGGFCLFFALFGPSLFDFEGRMASRLGQMGILEPLKADRASMLQQSSIRSFVFIGLAFLAIWAFFKGYLKKPYFLLGLGTIIVVDLWVVDRNFLNEEDFSNPNQKTPAEYRLTQADRTILGNKADNYYPGPPENWTNPEQHYRVYNTVPGDPFADAFTSYHHRSIGGYHAAKLIRYQDLIDRHLQRGNRKVLNMLNARWVITEPDKGSKKRVREVARKNPGALGNAWFVEELRWMKGPKETITALNDFDPSRTALVDQEFKEYFQGKGEPGHSNNSFIELTEYKANQLKYKAQVKGNKGHMAVFSEIYYEGSGSDWKVFIDGKEVPHIRVNYALRGLWIPAGSHKIEFKFHPHSYYTGEQISLASSIIIFLVILGAVLYEIRKKRQPQEEAESDEKDEL